MHNNNNNAGATRTAEWWFASIFEWMTLCWGIVFFRCSSSRERKGWRVWIVCVCVCASIASSFVHYELARYYYCGNSSGLFSLSISIEFFSFYSSVSVTVSIPVNSTVEWLSSSSSSLGPGPLSRQIRDYCSNWRCWLGEMNKVRRRGELRSIGNGNLHYTRGRIYIHSMLLLLFCHQRFIFIDPFFFLFVISPSISHSHWFRAVTRWSSCIVMGNSVDSGQRVFAMKTARKSSFCSGVTKNKKRPIIKRRIS